MLYTILMVVQVLVALSLIGLILVQHGKGADAGAAFGSGASGTVFGAQGSANFLSHATAGLAVVFFAVSLALAYLVGGDTEPTGQSVTEQIEQPAQELSIPEQGNALQNAPDAGQTEGAQQASGAASGSTAADEQSGEQGITAEIPE